MPTIAAASGAGSDVPRPRTDVAAAREALLVAAEALLKRNGGRRLTVSEVAAECGMSQSNAYRFFPSKAALLQAVGERWFEGIETALAAVVAADSAPEAALRRFLLTHLELKRARFDADPALFRAYLALAEPNMAIVERHLVRLRRLLAVLVARLLGRDDPDDPAVARTVLLVEDLTVAFRDPRVIATRRAEFTDARAEAVVAAILAVLRRRSADCA